MESLRGLWDAVTAFTDSLASVGIGALIGALLFHLANLLLRTRAWTNILVAAYPDRSVRWRDVFGSYCAGVGINGIVPARGGDAIKLFLVHSRIDQSTYPTIGASLLAETIFDGAVAGLLLIWAWQIGIADGLPGAGLFEFQWVVNNPQLVSTIAILLAGVAAAGLIIYGQRVRRFWAKVRQGLAILADRPRYLREVASLQAAGWVCRLMTAFLFLSAFNVNASLRNALLVLVVGSVATSLPLTPGGFGPKQALMVAVLAGEASRRSELLAFSVGMEAAILVFNLVLGGICLSKMLQGVRLRDAVRHARDHRQRTESQAPPPP